MKARLMYDWIANVELTACQCRGFSNVRITIFYVANGDIAYELIENMPWELVLVPWKPQAIEGAP